MWADNADFCAKQYTGTGALKTDFTRYVKTSSSIKKFTEFYAGIHVSKLMKSIAIAESLHLNLHWKKLLSNYIM